MFCAINAVITSLMSWTIKKISKNSGSRNSNWRLQGQDLKNWPRPRRLFSPLGLAGGGSPIRRNVLVLLFRRPGQGHRAEGVGLEVSPLLRGSAQPLSRCSSFRSEAGFRVVCAAGREEQGQRWQADKRIFHSYHYDHLAEIFFAR